MNYTVSTFHLGNRIDLTKTIGKIGFDIIKDEATFVLFKKNEESYIYVKSYGSIAFCNFDKKEKLAILSKLSNTSINYYDLVSEDYDLEIDHKSEMSVRFNTVTVPKFTIDTLHIVMLNLCQSVALENYQTNTNDLLETTRTYSDNLYQSGNVGLSSAKLRSIFGKTMVLKNRIAENLLIFETSDLAWSKEQLSDIDSALRVQLDMVNRYQGLQHSLDVVKENLDLFRDILQHKHSSTLEWIIIILILLEVADLIGSKFL